MYFPFVYRLSAPELLLPQHPFPSLQPPQAGGQSLGVWMPHLFTAGSEKHREPTVQSWSAEFHVLPVRGQLGGGGCVESGHTAGCLPAWPMGGDTGGRGRSEWQGPKWGKRRGGSSKAPAGSPEIVQGSSAQALLVHAGGRHCCYS